LQQNTYVLVLFEPWQHKRSVLLIAEGKVQIQLEMNRFRLCIRRTYPTFHQSIWLVSSIVINIISYFEYDRMTRLAFADCCDGSDEAVGLCASTCARDGAAAREELKAAAKTAASGYKVGH
jgi:hypothetical protein